MFLFFIILWEFLKILLSVYKYRQMFMETFLYLYTKHLMPTNECILTLWSSTVNRPRSEFFTYPKYLNTNEESDQRSVSGILGL